MHLPIKDAQLLTFPRYGDKRGYFNELYNQERYSTLSSQEWKQVSFSKSSKNVLRGLHCSPYGKFITCVRGAFYDVIADFRPDSPTFGRWCKILLTDENCRQVYVPAQCGHGFYTLEDDTCALYLQEGCFNPAKENDTHPFDPFINVQWPLLDGCPPPTLSAKDEAAPFLSARAAVFPEPNRRILVIGATGQIGGALFKEFGQKNCIGTYCSSEAQPGMVHYDMERALEEGYTELLFELCAPTHVFICTGFTWVDGCETQKGKCDMLNHTGPAHLCRLARQNGCKPVWFSTDYVFDGKNGPYTEEDKPNPINEYGRAKLRGEQAIQNIDTALILRTNVVYGPEEKKKNFVHQILGKKLRKVPSDQYGTPTHNADIASACAKLIDVDACGVVHVSGPDFMSREDVVRIVHSNHAVDGLESIEFVPTAELNQPAPRPLNAGLVNKK